VRLRTATTIVLALAAGLAAGCGSDEEGEPLPQGQATELLGQLDSIQARFEAGSGACNDITEGDDTNLAVVQRVLNSLPDDVDADLRDALTQSFDRLFELVREECAEEEPTETETTPTETETVPTEPETETTETETVPTETVPTETETTPTETETEPGLPPGQGGEPPGQGGENPGQGNGGGVVVPGEEGG
jgi:hypothetical protein